MRRDKAVTPKQVSITQIESEPAEWVVLDGRASAYAQTGFVPAEAAPLVMEACGRTIPQMRHLSKRWGQQGAWLAKIKANGFRLVKEIP